MEEALPKIGFKDLLNYSAMVGTALVAFSIVSDLAHVSDTWWANSLQLVVLAAGLYLVKKHVRDRHYDGYISFQRLLSLGVFVNFFAGIVLAFYIYISLSTFQSDLIVEVLEEARSRLLEDGKSKEALELAMKEYEQFYTPSNLALFNLFSVAILGFVVSLILSGILKNNRMRFVPEEEENEQQ